MGKKTVAKKPVASKKVLVEKVSTNDCKIIWKFDLLDLSGRFAFNLNRIDFNSKEVLEKIIHFSNMTWREVLFATHDAGKSKHHLLDPSSLSKEAIERLEAKHLEEASDSIFSFALQNKLRIIGIRDGEFFHVVWYDPNHEFCPSHKRNT
jgi:hypothetical protein